MPSLLLQKQKEELCQFTIAKKEPNVVLHMMYFFLIA